MSNETDNTGSIDPTAHTTPPPAADPLFGVSAMAVVPSLSVEGVLVDKGEYLGTITITDISVSQPHTLNKKAGLAVMVKSIVFKYTRSFHVGGVIRAELNRHVEDNVWLIIGPVDPAHVLSDSEKREISTRNDRAEKVLCMLYAQHSLTLTPDAKNGNRLGPLGQFMSGANWKMMEYEPTAVTIIPNMGNQGGWFYNYKPLKVDNAGAMAPHKAVADMLRMQAQAAKAAKDAAGAQANAIQGQVSEAQAAGIGAAVSDADLANLLGETQAPPPVQ